MIIIKTCIVHKVLFLAFVYGASLSIVIGAENIKEKKTTSLRGSQNLYFPNLLIIGAQKAGTTALFDWLAKTNNAVCEGAVFSGDESFYNKEIHFFDFLARYEQGPTFYSKRFEHCVNTSYPYRIDATPDTVRHPERVKETYKNNVPGQLKNLKMIYIVREPTSRAISYYNHLKKEYTNHRKRNMPYWGSNDIVNKDTGDVKTLDEYGHNHTFEKDYTDITIWDQGLYSKLLKKWFSLFERKNILILSYDEMKKDPAKFKSRVNAFLGTNYPVESEIPVSNTQAAPGINKIKYAYCSSEKRLAEIYEPFNQELYALLESNPGPSMEQRPFPKFELPPCLDGDKLRTNYKDSTELGEKASLTE